VIFQRLLVFESTQGIGQDREALRNLSLAGNAGLSQEKMDCNNEAKIASWRIRMPYSMTEGARLLENAESMREG
jgi:hypothetical protein